MIILGSSAGMPTPDRYPTAMGGKINGVGVLFDVGEGIQQQLMRYGISIVGIRHIFISHIHGDHVLGLPGLLQTRALLKARDPVTIWSHRRYLDPLDTLIHSVYEEYPFGVELREAEEVEIRGWKIRPLRLKHTIPCLGFVIDEGIKKKADKEKLRELGLLNNPLVRKLKEGEPVYWRGRKIYPEDVVYEVQGRKVVYAVDTRPAETVKKEAREAVLIHEATFTQDLQGRAEETGHSTALEAALLAREGKAKILYITHFSPRYKSLDPLLQEARAVFSKTELGVEGTRIDI